MTSITPLLMIALAFGQTSQPLTVQQGAGQPSSSQPPTAPPPAKQPNARPSVADAARASKKAQESAPLAKVYRNKDVKDPAEPGSSTAGQVTGQTAALPSSHPAASNDQAEIQKDRAFEAQAKVFKSQILTEKAKIIGIQNRMTSLKYRFDAWSTEYAQNGDAQTCWTSAYYTPYYRDWCGTGRDLKAQYDASQRQFDREQNRLEQMQDSIRRRGYGNAVYDPD